MTRQGELSTLYSELSEKEVVQNRTNPGNKSVYKTVCDNIKAKCIQFNNELAALKTHFKPAPKKRKKADAPAVPNVPETPAKNEPAD